MAGPAELTIDRTVAIVRTGLDGDSWVELVSSFVPDADDWMRTLHTAVRWQETEVLRYDRSTPEKRLSAGVRSDDHPLLRQTELHLRSRFRVAWTGGGIPA